METNDKLPFEVQSLPSRAPSIRSHDDLLINSRTLWRLELSGVIGSKIDTTILV